MKIKLFCILFLSFSFSYYQVFNLFFTPKIALISINFLQYFTFTDKPHMITSPSEQQLQAEQNKILQAIQSNFQPLQKFIFDLSQLQKTFKKADLTFIGIIPNEYNNAIFDSFDDCNKDFLRIFYQAIYGKNNEEFNANDVYSEVVLQDIKLYIKQFSKKGKLFRMVYIPIQHYDTASKQINDQIASRSYVRMVKKSFFSNMFMKPEVTNGLKNIAMDYLPKPREIKKGKLEAINIHEALQNLSKKLNENYNLQYQPQLSKISFIFAIEQNRNKISFVKPEKSSLSENLQVFMLTDDQSPISLYRLEEQQNGLKLSESETNLYETKNFVTDKNYFLKFHYNRFLKHKTTIASYNVLDKFVADQLWGIVETIIYPLVQVKRLISDSYKLPQQEGQTNSIFDQIEQKRWNSGKFIKNDLTKFYKLYDFNNQNNQNQAVQDENDDQCQVMIIRQEPSHKIRYQKNLQSYKKGQISAQELLEYFSQKFKIYSRFVKQQQNFNHSMILDQINILSRQFAKVASGIHKANAIIDIQDTEKKVLHLSKIIVRFLAQLKKHQLFQDSLQFYNPEINQKLLDIYLHSYTEFCYANKQTYGKLYDLSQKVSDLVSTKKQLLKVLKSVQSFTQLYKNFSQNLSIQDLQDKKVLLQILLKLLQENKSQEKDKEIDTKIMSAQYDLGSTYLKIALIQNYGQQQQQRLKYALKILYNELYLKLFIQRKDFEKQFVNMVNFDEVELLQKVSGLLKLLDRVDLAIEIEKKLDNITTVQNYYNRWLMKYHRLHGVEDQQKIKKICQKAIEYFSIKYEVNKVTHFYDLLIKNAMNFQQKSQWKKKRFRYLNYTRDSDWCKREMEKAQKTLFPISESTSNDIAQIYKGAELQLNF